MRKPTSERPHPTGMGGTQRLYHFSNGFGASVVQTPHSYGGEDGQWELAVIIGEDDKWESYALTYATPITDDVEGYLDEDGVDVLLDKIEALPSTSHKQALAETHAAQNESRAALKRMVATLKETPDESNT